MNPGKFGVMLATGAITVGGVPAIVCAEPAPSHASVGSFAGIADRAGGHSATRLVVRVREDISLRYEWGRVHVAGGGLAPDRVDEAIGVGVMSRAFGVVGVRPAVDIGTVARPELAREIGLDRYFMLETAPGTDVALFADALGTFGGVFERVDPDRIGELHGIRDGSEGQAPPPSDPEFGEQWALENTGQIACSSSGTAGADISALGAWAIHYGSEAVTVAVVDGGVNPHADLEGRLVPGQNFSDGGPNATGHGFNNHGTAMAGIIAAVPNNGIAIAGVSWEARIMPIRVFNDISIGFEAEVVNGLIWAADNGADIINMSFGFNPNNGNATDLLHDAVIYAYESGALLVASSGNASGQAVRAPAAFPEVIAVGATTNTDQIWSNSTSGPELSISAPGGRIRTLQHTPGNENSTKCETGTSASVAYISGVAALVMSRYPELSNDAVRVVLEATADDLGEPGWDETFGAGRVNAEAALGFFNGSGAPIRRPTCLADLNGDRRVDINDLLLFLEMFTNELPGADLAPPHGVFDFADVMAYLLLFGGGGCLPPAGML